MKIVFSSNNLLLNFKFNSALVFEAIARLYRASLKISVLLNLLSKRTFFKE